MIIQADILTFCESYEGEPFHAVLCDPPYGLNEAELDIAAVLADWLADREHTPKGAGFMGREWDSFLPGPHIWRAIRAVCHPGAFLFAFGGTRTADLLGLALRLAGWEKRDEIDWIYGSGFPKNQNISKAIDRTAKAERPVVGTKKHQPKFDAKGFAYREKDNGYNSKARETFDVTTSATDMAQTWDGYGTALKPAHEPILVFRNPLRGTYAQNCTRHGAGALNIAGGRIGMEGIRTSPRSDALHTASASLGTNWSGDVDQSERTGRWPANLILQHSPTCEPIGARRVRGSKGEADYRPGAAAAIPAGCAGGTIKTGRHHADADGYETIAAWDCAPDCPVAAIGRQSGETTEGSGGIGLGTGRGAGMFGMGSTNQSRYPGTGTAARFFFQADWMLDRLEQADPVAYFAKSSRSEREAGLDPRQIALLGLEEQGESTINDGRAKSIDNPYQRGETTRRNIHPTLKPLSLCRYLATLLLPPDAYAPRRLLVPFAGVGSEMIGAELAGWEDVVGVELEEEHVKIGEARLAYWRQRRHELLDPNAPITAVLADAPDGQLDMFE